MLHEALLHAGHPPAPPWPARPYAPAAVVGQTYQKITLIFWIETLSPVQGDDVVTSPLIRKSGVYRIIKTRHSIPLLTFFNVYGHGNPTMPLRRNWRHWHRPSASSDFLSRNPCNFLLLYSRCPYLNITVVFQKWR